MQARRSRLRRLAAAVSISSLVFVTSVVADDSHYATPLLGDRPTGMGSAATGLANESSAAYFNPAGLTRMQRSSISGGLFLKARSRLEIDDVLRSPVETENFSSTTHPSFPGFASGSFPLGHARSDGTRPIVLAFSSFTLYRTSQRMSAYLGTEATQSDSYTFSMSDRVTLYGFSAAWLPRRKWSVGMSIFLTQRRLSERETLATVVYGSDVTGPTYDDSRLVARDFQLSAKGYSFLLRIGMLHRPSPRTSWGLTLQIPGIELKARANVREQLYDNDATVSPPQGSYTYQNLKNLDAFLPFPLELRGGFSRQVSDRALIAADLCFVAPIPDRPLIEGNPAFAIPIDQVSLFAPTNRGRRPVLNVALGTEIAPLSNLIVRLGFLTDFSAAPKLPARSESYYTARLHRYGFSTSVGLRTWGRENWGRGVSFGFVAMFGRGKAMAAVLDPTDAYYERTSMNERTFYLTITGGLQTAEQLAVRAAVHVAPSMVHAPTPSSSPEPHPEPAPQGP